MMNVDLVSFRTTENIVWLKFLGSRRWEVLDHFGLWRRLVKNDDVGNAVIGALALSDEAKATQAYLVRVDSPRGHGAITRFPNLTNAWRYSMNNRTGAVSGASGLEGAIMDCLVFLRLRPVKCTRPNDSVPLERFFVAKIVGHAHNRQRWAEELSRALQERLKRAPEPKNEIRRLVAELTRFGYALTLEKESTDCAIWYALDKCSPQLRIRFDFAAYEDPAVRVGFPEA